MIGLEAVLDAEQQIIGDAVMFGAFLGEADQPSAQLRQIDQRFRQRQVAQAFKLVRGQKPLGRAGIAGDKDGLAILWAAVELQIR